MQREIKLRISDEVARGRYSNVVGVTHSDSEFILDFALVLGTAGSVVSRVVLSPAQAKRLAVTLEEHVGRFEHARGPVEPSPAPPFQIGFHPAD